MTPPPGNGADAVDRLCATLESLVNKLGGGSSGGGGGGPPKDPTKRLNKQWDSLSDRIEREFSTFGSVGKTSATLVSKLRYEFDKLNKAFRDTTGQTKAGTDAWVSLRKLEKQITSQIASKTGPFKGTTQAEKDLADAEKNASRITQRDRRMGNRVALKEDRDLAKEQKRTDAFWKDFNYNLEHNVKHSSSLLKKASYLAPGFVSTMIKWNTNLKNRADDFKDVGKELTDSVKRDEAIKKLKQDITDRLNSGGKYTLKDARKFERLGEGAIADKIRKEVEVRKQKDKDKRVEDFNISQHNKQVDADRKRSEQVARSQQAARDAQRKFSDKMKRREARGLPFTEAHLERAQSIGRPALASWISHKIQKQKDDAAQKRVEDFEIKQHNQEIDFKRKQAAGGGGSGGGGGGGAKGGSFFGGFGRNLAIGRLYAAVNAAAAPLEAFGAGVGTEWLKAWKELTQAAYAVGRNLSYSLGLGESAAQAANRTRQFTARIENQNAQYEMSSAVGSRVGAGMTGSATSLAKGVAEAVGKAMDAPLTGLTSIVGQIGNAVALADPGTMNRYNMILRDLTATIGQGLAPVVQLITRLMKEFGDYLQPVVSDMIPAIKKVMGDLFKAIQPLIPLFVKELTDTIKELVGLIAQFGGKLDLRSMIMRSLQVPEAIIKAGPNANPAEVMEQEARNQGGLMVAGGVAGGAALGAGLGSIVPGIGTVAGGIGGGILGGIAAYMDTPAAPNNNPAAFGMMANLANMRKGNIAGAAVAQNATIGSGSDIARRASQEAFIASSARGNIDNQQNLFQQAAQAALQFFQNQGKAPAAANGNAQAGVAPGKGQGAMAFGAGQGAFEKNARAMLWGMMNPLAAWG